MPASGLGPGRWGQQRCNNSCGRPGSPPLSVLVQCVIAAVVRPGGAVRGVCRFSGSERRCLKEPRYTPEKRTWCGGERGQASGAARGSTLLQPRRRLFATDRVSHSAPYLEAYNNSWLSRRSLRRGPRVCRKVSTVSLNGLLSTYQQARSLQDHMQIYSAVISLGFERVLHGNTSARGPHGGLVLIGHW